MQHTDEMKATLKDMLTKLNLDLDEAVLDELVGKIVKMGYDWANASPELRTGVLEKGKQEILDWIDTVR